MADMVEVQTSDLIGPALDWAVAKAIGWQMVPVPADADGANSGEVIAPPDLGDDFRFPPRGKIGPCYFLRKWSTDWAQGGPLIDKYKVSIGHVETRDGEFWIGSISSRDGTAETSDGPLVAACRAIVAAKLGDVVQVPSVLVGVGHA